LKLRSESLSDCGGEKRPSGGLRSGGTQKMADHLLKAYEVDIGNRTEGLEHSNTTGYKVNVHEINPGIIYKDENVTVKAFDAHHGELAQTFGFRFDTPDRTIVISGDATRRATFW
jgi:hypothetical protein